jgi:hypothetical protein
VRGGGSEGVCGGSEGVCGEGSEGVRGGGFEGVRGGGSEGLRMGGSEGVPSPYVYKSTSGVTPVYLSGEWVGSPTQTGTQEVRRRYAGGTPYRGHIVPPICCLF